MIRPPSGLRPVRGWIGADAGGRKSPNFGERRGVDKPDMVVIHYTAMQSAEAACNTLCDPKTQVSAHYLIDEAGYVIALVDEKDRAWHAGVGRWGQVTDVNSHSIGIELANAGNCPFSNAQIAALEDLLGAILDRWHIPPERVIGHSDMAPGRKIDPGVRFDWRRLAMAGLAVWPDTLEDASGGDFIQDLKAFGYTATEDVDLLLATLRRRFRPWACGLKDPIDAALISNLARRFPVDANLVSA